MLLHGDCLDVLPTLPDASVDMVFADLPYGVTAGSWDTPLDLPALWLQLRRAGKKNAAFVFTATQPFACALIASQQKMFRYDLIYTKNRQTGFFNAKRAPLRSHETVLVFYRAQPIYHPQMQTAKRIRDCSPRKNSHGADNWGSSGKLRTAWVENGKRYPGSVLSGHIANSRYSRLHPTQKPVSLIEWLIRTYTNKGDVVLDPTAGSGTTAIAAINTNRKWVCIEKDVGYHAVAAKRIAEHQASPSQGTLAV